MSGTTYRFPHDILRDKDRKEAKAALLKATNNTTDNIHLTKAEIALVFEDCYTDIANKKVDGPYISAVIDGIGMRVDACGYKSEDIKEGVEQVLALAARTIKGEGCPSCDDEDHCSGSGVSPKIHEHFVESIIEMSSSLQIPGWSMNHRASFSLDRLCTVFSNYHPLRLFLTPPAADKWGEKEEAEEQLEGMWCHQPWDDSRDQRVSACRCWDEVCHPFSSNHYHTKGCWGYCL